MIVCGTDIEPVGANIGDSVESEKVSTLVFWNDLENECMFENDFDICFGYVSPKLWILCWNGWTLDMLVQRGMC